MPWMYMKVISSFILSLLVASLPVRAERALFSKQELESLKYLKSQKHTVKNFIADWHERERGFFKQVLVSTSAEDLMALKADLPHVRERMSKQDDAKWLVRVLQEISQERED